MFQFPPCPPAGLCVQPAVTEYCSAGFPHSGISGSTFDDNSPKLIAAIRALHRLLAPRHPPHALSSLIHVRRQHLISATMASHGRTVLYVLLLFRSVVKVPRRSHRSPKILGSLAAAPELSLETTRQLSRTPLKTQNCPAQRQAALLSLRVPLFRALGSFPLLFCQTLTCVGLSGLEPLTPALSAQCSNRLSYRP